MPSTLHMPKIGFIGLGLMGLPMATRLINAGYRLSVQTRSGVPQTLLELGAHACIDACAVAEQADIIFLMLPDTPDVEKVLFAERGVCQTDLNGKTIVDMSTISPIATQDFAKRIQTQGGQYLDAPVSGGDVGAKAGTLTIMVGGKASVFEQVLPLFECLGERVTLLGDNGAGQTTKAANQIIVSLTIAAVSEALVFAAKAGVDPRKVREALLGGFAQSKILDLHGARMLERNFTPGFRSELLQKDLALVLDSARSLSIPLPGTALAQQLYNQSAAHGEAMLDNSALVKVFEKMANFSLDAKES